MVWTPAGIWGAAAAFVALYAWWVPTEPLVLTFLDRVPGVGPQPSELVAATVVFLLVVGVVDVLRATWWARVEHG
jgi:hypothetical protein